MSVGQVGNEGWAADARSSGPGGGRFGGFDEHHGVQVAVAREEAAVHPGAAGDRGDADFGAQMDSLLERGAETLPAPCAVGLPGRGDAVGVVVHGLSSPALNDEHLTDTQREPVVQQASDQACATVHYGRSDPQRTKELGRRTYLAAGLAK
jgi:hypothetical protein